MREWFKRSVSKTEEPYKASRVRILSIPPDTGVSSNGKTGASKTSNVGSIPTAPAKFMRLIITLGGSTLLDFEHHDGITHTNFSSDEMKNAAARWIRGGLRQLVKDDAGYMRPRQTDFDSPEFLPRLKEDIERQFSNSFSCILTD